MIAKHVTNYVLFECTFYTTFCINLESSFFSINFLSKFHLNYVEYLSLVMRKPAFCVCENKDADQLRVNREADQRLCFRYTDSTILFLHKSKI